MDDKGLGFIDKVIINATKYMQNPKMSFVFGGVFFLGFFYLFIHAPSIKNHEEMLANSKEDTKYWKKEYDDCETECDIKLKEERERTKQAEDKSFDNLIKTNSFLKELKSDKVDKASLSKKVADYQKEALK